MAEWKTDRSKLVSKPKHPDLLDVIRMYRKERDISYCEARDLAIKQFEKHGWPLPSYMSNKET